MTVTPLKLGTDLVPQDAANAPKAPAELRPLL